MNDYHPNLNGPAEPVGLAMDDGRPIYHFRWWYKGLTPEGNTAKFEGTGTAKCFASASRMIEAMMRRKYPTIRWMQGKEVEGGNLTYGPSIRMGKQKQNT